MTSKAAAIRYARALFDVALKEQADLEQIEAQLATFVDLFSQHPTLAKVLLNPAVPVPRKRAAVDDLTARLQIMPILAKLLTLLAERDRLVVLPDLLASYRDRLLDHRQRRPGRNHDGGAAVGRPGAGDRGAAGAGHRQDRDGVVARRSRPSSAALVARIGSTVYDASLTRQLEKIEKQAG